MYTDNKQSLDVSNSSGTEQLSVRDFNRLSQEIYAVCGIYLPENKRTLIEGRVRKRLKLLGMSSFGQYLDFLLSENGAQNEFIPLIDAVTTNKTDFFRENAHFVFLIEQALPEMISASQRIFSFWSAGCSTGEEPYTLAIVLNEFLEKIAYSSFSIYASDISTGVLQKAAIGIYDLADVEVIPMNLKKKYLLKSKDPGKQLVRMTPEIVRKVEFLRINFMDEQYGVPGAFDAVFCRNVLIYFDKPTQERVLGKISDKLRVGGYLFIGHSESIIGMKLPLKRIASTIYQKVSS